MSRGGDLDSWQYYSILSYDQQMLMLKKTPSKKEIIKKYCLISSLAESLNNSSMATNLTVLEGNDGVEKSINCNV